MLARPNANAKPPVHISKADYDVLSRIATSSGSPGVSLLSQELERATVVSDGEGPRTFVHLNSKVEFTDLMSGRARTVTVVLPEHADMDKNRLSVLAPAGAALLGLSPGDTFGWTVDGRPRLLVVNFVADAAGESDAAV
jgi:regulator of nucleoside diphosphate kinase